MSQREIEDVHLCVHQAQQNKGGTSKNNQTDIFSSNFVTKNYKIVSFRKKKVLEIPSQCRGWWRHLHLCCVHLLLSLPSWGLAGKAGNHRTTSPAICFPMSISWSDAAVEVCCFFSECHQKKWERSIHPSFEMERKLCEVKDRKGEWMCYQGDVIFVWRSSDFECVKCRFGRSFIVEWSGNGNGGVDICSC